jgi:hypothetical protein
MKRIIEVVFAASMSLVVSSISHAMPLASLGQHRISLTVPTAGGCGIGFHRGPLGGCVPNGRVVIVPAAPVVVAPAALLLSPQPPLQSLHRKHLLSLRQRLPSRPHLLWSRLRLRWWSLHAAGSATHSGVGALADERRREGAG